MPTIKARLHAGKDIDSLVSYLTHIRTELVGLSPRQDIDRATADAIVDWHHGTTPPEFRAWLDAKLVREMTARAAIRVKRLRLPPSPIQREHQLGVHPFPERVSGNQRL